MKKTFLTFLLLIGTGIFASYVYPLFELHHNFQLNVLKTAVPDSNLESFDPIDDLREAKNHVNKSIFGTLIQFDPKSRSYVSFIANRFFFDGNIFRLEIRDDVYSVDGWQLKPSDVSFSLKRFLTLKEGTISDMLRENICGNSNSSNILKDCNGIKVDGKFVNINFSEVNKDLISIFSKLRSSIVFEKAIDKDSLKVIDRRNTTGLYYIDREFQNSEGKGVLLKKNPRNWMTAHTENSPDEVLVFDDYVIQDGNQRYPHSFDLFLNGKINYIGPSNLWFKSEFFWEAQEKTNAEIFATNELASVALLLTTRGLQIKPEMRRFYSFQIQNAMDQYWKKKRNASKIEKDAQEGLGFRKVPWQFIPESCFGGLDDLSVKKGVELLSQAKKTDEKFIVSTEPNMFPYLKEAFENLDFIELKMMTKEERAIVVANKNGEFHDASYHAFLYSYGFQLEEDLEGIDEILDSNAFIVRFEHTNEWLKHYVTLDFPSRESALKELHYESIYESPSVIPIHSVGQPAISAEYLKMNLEKNKIAAPYSSIQFK